MDLYVYTDAGTSGDTFDTFHEAMSAAIFAAFDAELGGKATIADVTTDTDIVVVTINGKGQPVATFVGTLPELEK